MKLSQIVEAIYKQKTADDVLKYGEVMTPYELRQSMIDLIPPGFFNNKDHKVLEPCCGKGVFVFDIIDRFMEGLEWFIKDEGDRYKYIIENCLYFCDINPRNVQITQLCIVIKAVEYNLAPDLVINGLVCNFLDHEFDMKFDLIISNPPYNSPSCRNNGNIIYPKFTDKSLDLLAADGYLCSVHPPIYRKTNPARSFNRHLFDKMKRDNTMIYLNINNTIAGQKTFNCGTRYDWYLIKQGSPGPLQVPELTTIIDEDDKLVVMNLTDCEFLPNKNISYILENIITTNPDEALCCTTKGRVDNKSKHTNNIQTDEFKYKVLHTTPIKGIRYFYTNLRCEEQETPKIILGDSNVNPVVDKEGSLYLSRHSYGILYDDDEHCDKIVAGLRNEKFKTIIKSCSWSLFRIDRQLYSYIKKDFYNWL